MVIKGFKDFCYTGNYGELIISDIDDDVLLEIARMSTDEVLISELYAPDKTGFIRINGIGKVLQAHILLNELSFGPARMQVLNLSFRLKNREGEVLHEATQKVAYSRGYAVFGGEQQNFDRFISRYNMKHTTEHRQELVSFFCNGQVPAYAIAYRDEDQIKVMGHKLGTCTVADAIETMDFSISTIIARAQKEIQLTILPEDIIYYDAILYREEVVIDRIRFWKDETPGLKETSFLYYSLLGTPETVTFTGKQETADELNGEYAYLRGTYKKYTQNIVEPRKVNSGYIDRMTLMSIRDMLSSPVVNIYNNGVIEDEVVITEVDFRRKEPNNEPVTVTITYRKASELQEEFKREDYDEGIFVNTFETTFV